MRRLIRSILLGHVITIFVIGQQCAAESPTKMNFGKQVRPILAQRCYECHGPDKQEAGLRLDRREDALRGGDSGKAIQPRESRTSLIVQRLLSADPDERMPLGKKPLSAADIAIVQQWIEEGADWPDAWSGDAAAVKSAHWSFRALQRPVLPSVQRSGWVHTAIDAFVLSRLEQEGLAPSSEADAYTLVRRVYLDLLGLPPTPEEADEFVHDTRTDAYERLVDRLLASPRYGERWARRWLDLARYADTNGYEKDRARSIWPYRDWLVRALNEDLPFDQFTVKQLAGDMLPGATVDDRIATGFHRNTMLNEEGGIDPLEFRFHSVVDRVNTTGTTWLGLTIGCAQCHSHKYDPIEHHEYYQFMAFLNNADEPELELSDETSRQKRTLIKEQIARLVADLPNRFELPHEERSPGLASLAERRRELVERKFAEWVQTESDKAVKWIVLQPGSAQSNLPLLTILDDNSVLASGDQTKSDKYETVFKVDLAHVTAIRLEALPHESLPLQGPGRAYYEGPKGDFFLSEFRASVADQTLAFSRATHDYSKLAIGGGENGAQLTFDGNTTTGWSTHGREAVPHAAVYNLTQPVDLRGDLTVEMLFERHYSCGLGRFRISVTTDTRLAEARGYTAEIESILATPADQRSAVQREQLFQQFLAVAPELAAARQEIQHLRDSLPKPLTTLVLSERPDHYPRPTFLHHRGEFLQPKEKVEARIPAFLPGLPARCKPDRLGLAHWLVSPDNPLTARVTVNRQWQALFGRGLVRTAEDFGLQGDEPTHPELLDWLACEFSGIADCGFSIGIADLKTHSSNPQSQWKIRNPQLEAWDLKRLHRLIVTSSTYRQSSRITRQLLQRDPDNLLLARGPRVRLEAELVRDAALQAAGLLSTKMGGPGVFPPQPASVTTEGTYGALAWTPSPGEDRYRRGLYTYIKRTAPFAFHITFDAPSGEACVARRDVSNSPLQALTLLNDVIFLEAAQALGRLAISQATTDEARAILIFRRCLTRPPAADELQWLIEFAQQQRMRLAGNELDPQKFAGPGQDDVLERATWTAVARALLNLHETITKG